LPASRLELDQRRHEEETTRPSISQIQPHFHYRSFFFFVVPTIFRRSSLALVPKLSSVVRPK